MSSQRMIIAVDAGNTRAKFGAFHVDDQAHVSAVSIHAVVLNKSVNLPNALERWSGSLPGPTPVAAVIAGSNPLARDSILDDWPLRKIVPRMIFRSSQIPVGIDVDFPDRVGIDRLLNVYAASGLLTDGPGPVISIDSGTATTVDLMTSNRVFRGGSILPGLRLSAIAMHEYTARLPLINVDDEPAEEPPLPGRNTEAAMRAGLFWGQLGAVRELSGRLTAAAMAHYGETSEPRIFLTGGGGRQMARYLPNAIFVDCLALNGLAMLTAAELRC
jgi:type III pantothenate kinase